MSDWQQYDIAAKIITILREVPTDAADHHFGRPFLTAYQIAIAFAARYQADFEAIGLPIGGTGTGQRNSLAQYLAGELSRRIKAGTLPEIEGTFISNRYLDDITFKNGTQIIRSSLTESQYPLSMYRLREPAEA